MWYYIFIGGEEMPEKKLTIRFDEENTDLHIDFKIQCVKENISMQQKVIELIKNYLEVNRCEK